MPKLKARALKLKQMEMKIEFKVGTRNLNLSSILMVKRQVAAYFNEARVSKVRRAAVGGGANLWRAVKLAKNLNSDNIPLNLTLINHACT